MSTLPPPCSHCGEYTIEWGAAAAYCETCRYLNMDMATAARNAEFHERVMARLTAEWEKRGRR